MCKVAAGTWRLPEVEKSAIFPWTITIKSYWPK